MKERLAQELLESVFFRASAVISMDQNGTILGVRLFSTDWPEGHLRVVPDAHEVWLISNHPEGDRSPYHQDLRNCDLVRKIAGGARIRFFLSSEYFSCFEAEMHKGEDECDIIG